MVSIAQLTVEEVNRHLPVTVTAHHVRDLDLGRDQDGVDRLRCLVQVVHLRPGRDRRQYREDMDRPVFLIEEGLPGRFFKRFSW